MTGIGLILEERHRQVTEEGWSAAHDFGHEHEELAWAAVCYAAPSGITADKVTKMGQWNCRCRSAGECYCSSFPKTFEQVHEPWPWEDDWHKKDKHNRVRQLVIAGALIAAEIDRLTAKEKAEQPEAAPPCTRSVLRDRKALLRDQAKVGEGVMSDIIPWEKKPGDSTVAKHVHPLVRIEWLKWISRRAKKNLEKWGVQDFETLGLAIAEETGELAQAILQNKHEDGERKRITQEAIDLAALCIQVLVTMKEKHGTENIFNALFGKDEEEK